MVKIQGEDAGAMTKIGNDRTREVTPVLDTNAFAQNDIMLDTTEIPGVFPREDDICAAILNDLQIQDNDITHHRAMTILILRTPTSIGTANAAEAISTANAKEIIAEIAIASGDYVDHANYAKVQKKLTDSGMGHILQPKNIKATSLWFAIIYTDATGDAYAASDLTFKFGFQVN